jgi:hypothetical protein
LRDSDGGRYYGEFSALPDRRCAEGHEPPGEEALDVEGTRDHGAEMMFTWDPDGNPTGAVVNPACPSQVVETTIERIDSLWNDR